MIASGIRIARPGAVVRARPPPRRVRDAARHRRQARRHARPPDRARAGAGERRGGLPGRDQLDLGARRGAAGALLPRRARARRGRHPRPAGAGGGGDRRQRRPVRARPRWSTTWPPIRAGTATPRASSRPAPSSPCRCSPRERHRRRPAPQPGGPRPLHRRRPLAHAPVRGHPGADAAERPPLGRAAAAVLPHGHRPRRGAREAGPLHRRPRPPGGRLLAPARRRDGALARGAAGPAARRHPARHRQDHHPRPHPRQALAARRRGDRDHARHAVDGASIVSHLANPLVLARRAQPPRADRRQGLPRRPRRRRDPARRPHHRGGRHLRRHDHQPPLPRRPAAGARRRRDPGAAPAASSARGWWPPSGASSRAGASGWRGAEANTDATRTSTDKGSAVRARPCWSLFVLFFPPW